jgi:adenylate cyclase class 2
MPIEIEKKYQLTNSQREGILQRLTALGLKPEETVFEVNSIYTNQTLSEQDAIVRIRRIDGRNILTFKKRFPSSSGIKHQLEEETEVKDAAPMEAILAQLGLNLSLVYEKRRQTWNYRDCEIAIDELPFGWFMEIEGPENEIQSLESELHVPDLVTEEKTYPALTRLHGKHKEGVVEARFLFEDSPNDN